MKDSGGGGGGGVIRILLLYMGMNSTLSILIFIIWPLLESNGVFY